MNKWQRFKVMRQHVKQVRQPPYDYGFGEAWWDAWRWMWSG